MATKTHCKIIATCTHGETGISNTLFLYAFNEACARPLVGIKPTDIHCELINDELHFNSLTDARMYLRAMWRFLKHAFLCKGDGISPDGKTLKNGEAYATIVKGY